MNLTIGSTTLELSSFRKIRDKVVGVYADIKIPTTAITYDELKALFTDNAEDLIVTEDDGSTVTYSGYAELDEIREKGGVYTVIQICTSETLHLLNEARKQIEVQQGTITEMNGVITAQTTALDNHAKAILEQAAGIDAQGSAIEAQAEQMAKLEETSVMQSATIESMLLEAIPFIVETAVYEAVANALANNSDSTTTEDETVEPEETDEVIEEETEESTEPTEETVVEE